MQFTFFLILFYIFSDLKSVVLRRGGPRCLTTVTATSGSASSVGRSGLVLGRGVRGRPAGGQDLQGHRGHALARGQSQAALRA